MSPNLLNSEPHDRLAVVSSLYQIAKDRATSSGFRLRPWVRNYGGHVVFGFRRGKL